MSAAILLTLALLAPPRGLEVVGLHYQAVVGGAGQLLSLRVGAAEALDPMAPGGGGALLDPLPVALDRFQREANYVTARGADAVVTYQPGPERLVIHALNASARPRSYRLALDARWKVDGRRAVGPSGAVLTLARPESVQGAPWSVPVPAYGAVYLELRVERPPSLLLGGDTLWAEGRTFDPGRFVLHAEPPDVDPGGTKLNLPLVLCNESDDDRVTVCSVTLGDQVVSESVTLSARRAHGYDVRFNAPPPGAHAVRVKLRAGLAESVSEFTLAFAPERWPEAVSAAKPLPAGKPLRPVLRAAPAPPAAPLPAGWQSVGLTDGAQEHGQATWQTARGGDALLLLGGRLPDGLTGPAMGLATAELDDNWLPSLWSLLADRGREHYGVYCTLPQAPDLSRLSRAAATVAAWGPPWPAGSDRPMLVGQAVTPEIGRASCRERV